MSIGKTLVMVILAAHLLSCLWFWVSCYEALSLVRWVAELSTRRVLESRNQFSAYASSFQKGNARHILELHGGVSACKDSRLFTLIDVESCLLFKVTTYLRHIKQGEPKPWEQCGSPDSVASQYLSSFYFIIYTMMTVGYGDQHADPSSIKVSERGDDFTA